MTGVIIPLLLAFCFYNLKRNLSVEASFVIFTRSSPSEHIIGISTMPKVFSTKVWVFLH